MTNVILKASLIFSVSILVSSAIERLSPNYNFEVHGGQFGFTVRSNKTNGDRCLLDEGAVRATKDWYKLAHAYPVPLKICDDAKKNRIVFLDEPPKITNDETPNSKAEGPFGIFDDLIPDKNKK